MTMTRDVSETPTTAAEAPSRVRFQGVVEAAETATPSPNDGYRSFEAWAAREASPETRHWTAMSRQMMRFSRLLAILVFGAMVTFWPVLTAVGYWRATGGLDGWNLIAAYPVWSLSLLVVLPPLILGLGYFVSRLMIMMGAAAEIATAARELVQPEETALYNVESVGSAVRAQMQSLNAGIDDALISLASVEAMIRRHVEAIERAGSSLESRASGAFERIADERARLIELTEHLNVQADDFATAIAEKAQASIETLGAANGAAVDAEARLEDRLGRLEIAARRAVESFESLTSALADADGRVQTTAASIAASTAETKRASEVASRVADAAAETAARNAANVGQFAVRASEEARQAADRAIEAARSETERAANAAVDAATREAMRVAEAAARALENVRSATDGAVEAASADADRAVEAANLVSDAARMATEAASAASAEVRKVGDDARRAAEEALASAARTAERVESRNRELSEARAALEAENARLETLIDEQRKRAERLAEAIATQTERLSKLAESQLREQEASARLAEAQAALQAKAAEQKRVAEREAAARRSDVSPSSRRPDMSPPSRRPDMSPPSRDSDMSPPSRRGEAEDAASLVNDRAEAARRRDAERTPEPRGPARPGQRPPSASDRRRKDGVSWRQILDATDGAEPLDLGAAERGAPSAARQAAPEPAARPRDPATDANDRAGQAMRIIHRLQNFTLNLEARLYGDPPTALVERFEAGDRNVFANRLLRLNEADVKRRIRNESARDKAFEKAVHDFLQGFERLLEDATTSNAADEELEEYLSSPLGRVYLLIGATVGYFA